MANLTEIFRQVDDQGKTLSKNDFTDYLKSLLDNVQKWGKTSVFQGELKEPFAVMSNPPAISITKDPNGNRSTIDPNKVNGGVTFPISDSRIQLVHSIFQETDAGDSRTPADITLSTGAKTSVFAGIRFATDAPAFELCFNETNGIRINVLVDGKFAYRSEQIRFANTGNRRYVKFDFGENVTKYSKADASVSIVSGGANHKVGDVVTMGSSPGEACTVAVATVNATTGAATLVTILKKGLYDAVSGSQPTGTLSQTATTGTGTGLQIGATFFGRVQSTKKPRNIEVIWTGGGKCFGIVTTANDLIFHYKTSPLEPKLVVVGDSQSQGTYLDYVGGHLAYTIAQKLGMTDNFVLSAQGGTGWNKDNIPALRWSSSQRIADLIAHQGDVYLFIGSQNDAAGSDLTAAVTSTLNQLRAALPNALFVGVGPVVGNGQAVNDSIAAGFAAANDQKKIRYIDNVTNPWFPTTILNNIYTTTSDNLHLNQEGANIFAHTVANHVTQALSSMIKNPL